MSIGQCWAAGFFARGGRGGAVPSVPTGTVALPFPLAFGFTRDLLLLFAGRYRLR